MMLVTCYLCPQMGLTFQKKYIFNFNHMSVDSFDAICYDKQTNLDF